MRATLVGAVASASYACANDYGDIGIHAGPTETVTSASVGAAGGSTAASGGQGPGGAGAASVGGSGGTTCSGTMADCDRDGTCETDTASDDSHCGGCHQPCDDTNAVDVVCEASVCVPVCAPGFGSCNPDGANDGCETSLTDDPTHCGGCGNACAGGLICFASVCRCSDGNQCNNGGACIMGQCTCTADVCQPGELCKSGDQCGCNGGAGCPNFKACCQSPPGCFDLSNDVTSCGGCGHACAPGETCILGVCQ